MNTGVSVWYLFQLMDSQYYILLLCARREEKRDGYIRHGEEKKMKKKEEEDRSRGIGSHNYVFNTSTEEEGATTS